MPELSISIVIPSDKFLQTSILNTIAERLTSAFTASAGKIRERVGIAVVAAIQNSSAYTSLLSGELRGQLGVINAEPVLKKLCDNLAAGVVVTSQGARVRGSQIAGGMTIQLLKGDYSEVLNIPGGSFRSEGGFEIDWLKWLTTFGDQIIVANYGYYTNRRGNSRTGMGIMAQPGAWRVPPQFSGTPADNWITRAIATIEDNVEKILIEEIQRGI